MAPFEFAEYLTKYLKLSRSAVEGPSFARFELTTVKEFVNASNRIQVSTFVLGSNDF